MTQLWRAHGDMTRPEAVEAEVPCYPNSDANGDRIYENTHFKNEADAWLRLERERLAHVRLSGATVKECQDRLRAAEQKAAQAAMLYSQFEDNYREWFRSQSSCSSRSAPAGCGNST